MGNGFANVPRVQGFRVYNMTAPMSAIHIIQKNDEMGVGSEIDLNACKQHFNAGEGARKNKKKTKNV